MEFTQVFGKMLELFLLIVVGYVGCKGRIFDRETRVRMTKVVLDITMPAMILSSVLNQENLPGAMEIVKLCFVAATSYVVLAVFAFVAPVILRVKKEDAGVYRFMCMFGNVGFIGFPVTQAIFGHEAVFYTAVFNLPFNLLVFSAGIMFLNQGTGKERAAEQKSGVRWRTMVTPGLVASILSLIMALSGFRGPKILGNTCAMLGDVTTPVALMIIGAALADMSFREMAGDIRIYLFSVIRLILVPLATFGIYRMFIPGGLLLGVCVIMAAMPVATNGTMLCLQYNRDEKLMAQGTFVTTLASVVTIPLIAMLFA